MTGKIPDLPALPRTRTGKGAARQARRDGFVPGVVYGGGGDPLPINVRFNTLFKMLNAGRFLSTLFNLQVDGQDDVRVICRGVQRDVVNELPTHVDFVRIHQDSRINMQIPIAFTGHAESPGLKMGGVLTVVRNEVELVVTAGDIPAEIPIRLDGMEIGDVVTISMIELPEGTEATITDRDFVIANISAPSSLVEEVGEEEVAGDLDEDAASDTAVSQGEGGES
ncbi:MAG: 50S ribosomal protein L25/general stress protein Ctc [Rhodobacteraceae bacterium]|nr:50S ribosomal protein L25/general stress protein Ctc [Paracoccaceae bacterium]